MKLTAELSLYPLQENYVEIIREFIAAANEHGGLEIVSNAMSSAASRSTASRCWSAS